jgi:hypothetical protein
MSSRTVVELTDDIDGSPADETVTFTIQGSTYEIDLSKRNLDKLVKAMEPYTTHGRKSGGRRSGTGRSTGKGSDKVQLKAMREWGSANGYKVSSRGRVSADLQNAYHAAN